jgi:hypothetical protein
MNNCKFKINKEGLLLINNSSILEKLKKDNKYMSLLSLNEADYLKDLEWFRFDYILDNRTRIYIKNIPLNPQLEKILRPLIINNFQNDDIILKKYIKVINEFRLELYQVFGIISMSNANKERLVSFINENLKFKGINKEKLHLALFNRDLSLELIFAQQVYDILIRLKIKLNNKIVDQLVKKLGNCTELEDVGFFNELNK